MAVVKSKKSDTVFQEFAEKYSFYIPETHKNFLSEEDLHQFLSARYHFFRKREKELRVDVYYPDAEFVWLSNSCVVEILLPDSPFIVDTVVDICNAEGVKVQVIIHPIFSVTRNKNGILQKVEFPDAPGEHESYVYLEISRLTKKELGDLQRRIENNLRELREVVTDYPKMMDAIDELHLQNEGVLNELAWLKRNFVLLGLSALENGRLVPPHFGILKKKGLKKDVLEEISGKGQSRRERVRYRYTNLRSSINKARQMYLIEVKGKNATLLLAGHFRYRADISLRNNIPPIRRMLDEMALDLKVPSTSYLRKELYKTAQALPVGLLLTRPKNFLLKWFLKIISNMYTTEVIYDISADKRHNTLWVQVILPLTDAGRIPGRQLQEFVTRHHIAMVHTIRHHLNQIEVVFLGFRSSDHTLAELRRLMQTQAHELFSTWSSRFRELVAQKNSGDENIRQITEKYLKGMSPDCEVHQEPEEVLNDLDTLEQMSLEDGYRVHFYHRKIGQEDLIKIYACAPAKLSELVPILTNFGFIINRDFTFPYAVDGTQKFTYVFSVQENASLLRKDRERIGESITAVLNKKLTSRSINELVLNAGLSARELNLAKAFCSYFYKIDNSFAFSSIQKTLVSYPTFTGNFIRFFKARFNPDASPREAAGVRTEIEKSFSDLRSVEDERICRTLLNIAEAIVRTNYFQNKAEISFKIRSADIDNMPKPVPHFEIYIYSHDMEGVHLRGGPVARGGIRWSDRQDDLRTEVLGLMKAQMVKNTVIVPVGSKGGFVVKNRTFENREQWREAGVEMYKRFISCLLELTDNLSPTGKGIAAKGIKRYDGDDPYLVVAADKGTATFSDIANQISTEKKFWLTDAFASGGSNGYDHKKQGITARGAWESVRRHFHEVGINPEKGVVTAVGIGDMGGDVFGNGMLLSRTLRLVAAFNHLFIFIDPNPDPETSFEERQRLFREGGNWDAYNPKLISAGGGIYARSSRKIDLSPEAQQRLGIRTKSLSGEDLIKAILKSPVDLIWNGGIGTYVKADRETHFQAGDPANDRVRINASELRAEVLAEGGNLGLTQAARVQAAKQGVRLNTDAIDNSAGVNMSDHEVNLKILLDNLRRKKIINGYEERNRIIREYEQHEIKHVLLQNYRNNLGLSLDARRMPSQFVYLRSLIKFLNRKGVFDKEKDCIPFETDLDRIEQESKTLVRPVLCSLVGFAKLYGEKVFLESDGFRDPWYDRFIVRYFPDGLSEKYTEQVKSHPLKREIIITEVLNDIVNHAGLTFFQRMHMETGKPLIEIADTYLRLSEFLQLGKLRTDIEPAGEWLNASVHYEYLMFLEEKVYQIAKRLLKKSSLLSLLNEADSDHFNNMLHEAARHSRFRLPRKLKITMRMESADEALNITESFKRVDILEDTFNIFINNKSNDGEWQIVEYFTILQQYRIHELRRIMKDEFSATSSWEMRFFSKIETAIELLIARIVALRHSDGAKQEREDRQRIKSIIDEIIEQEEEGHLSTAAFYEMVGAALEE